MNHQQNFLQFYATHYCQHDINSNDISTHIAKEHLNDVFIHCIQHSFPTQSQQIQTRQRSQTEALGDDSSVEQKWKKLENGYDTVDVMEWMVKATLGDELELMLPKLLPLVLRVLDDYDVVYKTRGVLLVHEIVTVLDFTVITNFGLENVFIDALFRCLHYLSDDRDLPLLRSSYSCLIDLINKSKPVDSKERCLLYEKMMVDGVIRGLTFAGNKPKFLIVLLEVIDHLALELGVLLIRYMKPTVYGICNGLSSVDTKINEIALTTLKLVIQKTSSRIAPYGGDVLGALATLWLYHCNKKDATTSQMICNKVRSIYRILYNVCQGQLKTDAQALLDLDRASFEPLLL